MKNKFLVTMIVLSIFSYAQGQDKGAIGLKGGLNIAYLTNDAGSSYTAGPYSQSYKSLIKFGPHIGAYTELKISEMISFQPELLFSLKGNRNKYEQNSPGYFYEEKSSTSLYYLDIPLQLRLNVGKGFHVLAGPYLGFLLGAKYKEEQEDSKGFHRTFKSSSTRGIETVEGGIYLGTGYELESGLGFGLRWCKGFTDLYKGSGTNTNSVFQFSFSYKLASF